MRHQWQTISRPVISNSSNMSASVISALTSELHLMLMICWPEDDRVGAGRGGGGAAINITYQYLEPIGSPQGGAAAVDIMVRR